MKFNRSLGKKRILEVLEGLIIHSRKYNKNICVKDGSFYEFELLKSPKLFISEPDIDDLELLCDDMFYEEYGVEPSDEFAKFLFDLGAKDSDLD